MTSNRFKSVSVLPIITQDKKRYCKSRLNLRIKKTLRCFLLCKEKFIFAPRLIFKKLIKMAYVISEDCIACGSCIGDCPVEAISEGDIYHIDPEMCTDCGTCADACPMGAIVQA